MVSELSSSVSRLLAAEMSLDIDGEILDSLLQVDSSYLQLIPFQPIRLQSLKFYDNVVEHR